MKTWALILTLLPIVCNATGTSITSSGGSPIPSSFSASNNQSKVMECNGNVVEILNQSSTVLAVGFGTSGSAPSSDYLFVPGGPNSGHSFKPAGGLSSGTYVYIRGLSAITSGTVQVTCYYEDK
jgi:hypothetical protein